SSNPRLDAERVLFVALSALGRLPPDVRWGPNGIESSIGTVRQAQFGPAGPAPAPAAEEVGGAIGKFCESIAPWCGYIGGGLIVGGVVTVLVLLSIAFNAPQKAPIPKSGKDPSRVPPLPPPTTPPPPPPPPPPPDCVANLNAEGCPPKAGGPPVI